MLHFPYQGDDAGRDARALSGQQIPLRLADHKGDIRSTRDIELVTLSVQGLAHQACIARHLGSANASQKRKIRGVEDELRPWGETADLIDVLSGDMRPAQQDQVISITLLAQMRDDGLVNLMIYDFDPFGPEHRE